MTMRTDENYYQRIARSVGVPEMYLEDCVQEIRLGLWLAERDGKEPGPTIARRRAIDFSRQVTHHRYNKSLVLVPLEGHTSIVEMPRVEELIDLETEVLKLNPRQRQALEMACAGYSQTEIGACQSRTKSAVSQALRFMRAKLRRNRESL